MAYCSGDLLCCDMCYRRVFSGQCCAPWWGHHELIITTHSRRRMGLRSMYRPRSLIQVPKRAFISRVLSLFWAFHSSLLDLAQARCYSDRSLRYTDAHRFTTAPTLRSSCSVSLWHLPITRVSNQSCSRSKCSCRINSFNKNSGPPDFQILYRFLWLGFCTNKPKTLSSEILLMLST